MSVVPTSFVPFRLEEIEQSIPSRFEHQVRLHAHRLAVKTAEHTWTYDQLNRVANRVAHAVLARNPAGRTPVALLLEQGAPLIAALLGVLKAGKVVVTLDPAHPLSRLAEIVLEAQTTCIVTNAAHVAAATTLTESTGAVILVEAPGADLPEVDPDVASAPDDPAMILYTSGSTGRPKGVLCDHRSWIHNARNYINSFRVSPEDRLTLFSLGTSQAMKNLLMALLSGASLFPCDVRRHGLDGLAALLTRESITITVMGASLFRSLVDVLDESRAFPALRLIRLGSEPVHARDVELYKRHFPSHCLLVNGLASGETQTIRFFAMTHQTEVRGSPVPVGYAVEDKTVLLLDDADREVPPGQVGEIVVRSRYLALGYWRRPDLTDTAFRPADAPGGPRLYYTGDLGRMEPGGSLVCLGRKNARVKVRGHGVDLLEIETALVALGSVKEAVVVPRENEAGYVYLVAYVVPVTFPGPTNGVLRGSLGRTLPDFMIPQTFVVLGALPRTTSGKLDRQALPAPGHPYRDPSRQATPPHTAMESAVAGIWSEVMGQESVGVHDHFYDLGGDSLQAMRIMARIRKIFAVDVDLQALLDAPTVAEMAQTVGERLAARPDHDQRPPSERDSHRERPHLAPLQPGDGPRTVFFIPGGVGGEGEFFVYARLARHVGPRYPFYGLRARSAEGRELSADSVEQIASDYLREIRSRQPQGPYVLVGECGGGVVAYEMAQQLRAEAQEVALLVLMDTLRPDDAVELRAHFLNVRRWTYHREQLRPLKGKDRLGYVWRASQRMLRNVLRSTHRASGCDVDDIRGSYARAIHRYRPKPYLGRLTLLVNEELSGISPSLGWADLVPGGIESRPLPGNHISYIRGNVQAAARALRECLERAEKGPVAARSADAR